MKLRRSVRCFSYLVFSFSALILFIVHNLRSDTDVFENFVLQYFPKRDVSLIVGILSAGIRFDRRAAVRATWLQHCYYKNVVCKFFTDEQNIDDSIYNGLLSEQNLYHDLEFIKTSPGRNFGLRLLRIMEWCVQRYNFEFFLRVDDDQFVCLDRLVQELPFRPKKMLYWGFFYCREGIVRADEGWSIVTRDLVQYFVENEDNLVCSPHGDQQLAIWMKKFPTALFFYDNNRVIHNVSTLSETLGNEKEICQTYLSIHGIYPNEMRTYWSIFLQEKKIPYTIPKIEEFSKVCSESRHFNWTNFKIDFRFEPRPCRENPSWDEPKTNVTHIKNGIYVGRSGVV